MFPGLPTPPPLAPFPAPRPDVLRASPGLERIGIGLRTLTLRDVPWLQDLHADSRAEELAPVPWPDAAKRAFLDQQFAAQHAHYIAHFADADYLAIERSGEPLGRYYLQRGASEHLIVDVCLFPQAQGGGLGSALIRHSQQVATAAGCDMTLHVRQTNPAARRLYLRLGFEVTDEDASYAAMRWQHAAA